MTDYQLRHFSDGRILRSDPIEADFDIDAVREAGRLVSEHRAELWCGDRKVMTFDGRDPPR